MLEGSGENTFRISPLHKGLYRNKEENEVNAVFLAVACLFLTYAGK